VWYRRWESVLCITTPDGRTVEYDENNNAHVFAAAQPRAKVFKAVTARIRRSYWMGPHCLHDGASPYSHRHFGYVPFWCFAEDRTGVPFGLARGMMYQQDALNSGISKMRWAMSSVRTERTDGAIAMSDAQFRQQIGRVDADIVLDATHMARPGAMFKVHRDFQMTDQQHQMLQDARAAIERVSAVAAAFRGQKGTATSGLQEQTQVEQANQTLASIMDNRSAAREIMGEMLMSFIIEDMGENENTVIIEGDAITEDRTVTLNAPAVDPATGVEYRSNDVQRTRLKVALAEVPSTNSYRAQQLNALSESVKSLPPNYQAPWSSNRRQSRFKSRSSRLCRMLWPRPATRTGHASWTFGSARPPLARSCCRRRRYRLVCKRAFRPCRQGRRLPRCRRLRPLQTP